MKTTIRDLPLFLLDEMRALHMDGYYKVKFYLLFLLEVVKTLFIILLIK